MSYGLRVREADGTIIMDTSKTLMRQRYDVLANAGASGNSGSLTDASGLNSLEYSIPVVGENEYGCGHRVYRSSNTLYWVAQSGVNLVSLKSLCMLILYS